MALHQNRISKVGKSGDHYVHHSAVDVPKLFEAKEPGPMGAVIEYIALESGKRVFALLC